ncbi:response regulator transcription factor [Magnetospirillum sulfuroxidans]|uniref:Response regulator transcription factor n=1 Tax=Magnetospirillum sulfuroxidans TaxID=611300 RepID=A0ABS5I6V6_9PROT|nr:response regulator transcription factor [Magnetospirillum sulfuroxidans]MBR9970161.1 response regulator transcription factor [Magnetospirillum sulfuroxidans]
MHVLLIEDDAETAEMTAQGLRESGHRVMVATGQVAAEQAVDAHDFDAMVLDRMLPDGDGLDFLRRLRERGDRIPVVLLSALGDVDQRIEGLRAGGDDYLPKPCALAELLARLDAVTRRRDGAAATFLRVGDLHMDLIARVVQRGGQDIALQPREFRLLEFMMRRPGQVITRAMLLEGVWHYRFDPQTKVIDVQLSRLRHKIDKDFSPPLIHTVRGIGYCIGALDQTA